MKYPFIRPDPPKISKRLDRIKEIEASGHFTNFGPVNSEFCRRFVVDLYDGNGSCITVCNATIGLMLTLKALTSSFKTNNAKYVILPSYTFTATAQAAIWCGFEPLFCDIDGKTLHSDFDSIRRLISQNHNEIAAIITYATFGNPFDISEYMDLRDETGIPIMIDAASSIGSKWIDERSFGYDSNIPLVFSTHATKFFSAAEGGIVYSSDIEFIENVRHLSNFGFNEARQSIDIGLNGKMSEIVALLCDEELIRLPDVIKKKMELLHAYEKNLGPSFLVGWAGFPSYQGLPVRLPPGVSKEIILAELEQRGVGAGSYFYPPLHRHPAFEKFKTDGDLLETIKASHTVIQLPMTMFMDRHDVEEVCRIFLETLVKKS